jgi:hypothetical protein
MFAGCTNVEGATIAEFVGQFRAWQAMIVETQNAIQQSLASVEEDRWKRDTELFALWSFHQFEILHASLERLSTELPHGVQAAHPTLARNMASRNLDVQRRCIEFKNEVLHAVRSESV